MNSPARAHTNTHDSELIPSYELTFEDIAHASFEYYGVLCRREGDRITTNVTRTFENGESSDFAWGADAGALGLALSTCILQRFLTARPLINCEDAVQQLVIHLAPVFAKQFIATMPNFGGRIQLKELDIWIKRKLRVWCTN